MEKFWWKYRNFAMWCNVLCIWGHLIALFTCHLSRMLNTLLCYIHVNFNVPMEVENWKTKASKLRAFFSLDENSFRRIMFEISNIVSRFDWLLSDLLISIMFLYWNHVWKQLLVLCVISYYFYSAIFHYCPFLYTIWEELTIVFLWLQNPIMRPEFSFFFGQLFASEPRSIHLYQHPMQNNECTSLFLIDHLIIDAKALPK